MRAFLARHGVIHRAPRRMGQLLLGERVFCSGVPLMSEEGLLMTPAGRGTDGFSSSVCGKLIGRGMTPAFRLSFAMI